MNKKKIIGFSMGALILIISGLSFAFYPKEKAEIMAQKKPNILFLVIDDLKPVLGAYGNK